MLESKIQAKIKKKLEADGYFVTKLTVTSTPGIPDLLAIKDGKALFIEVKQDKGIVSPLQLHRHEQLRSFGCQVNIWTDYKKDYESI